jgi:predicted amidohydrolase
MSAPMSAPAPSRLDRPPRKVLVGTVVSGYDVYSLPLEDRFRFMEEKLAEIAASAGKSHRGWRLDLVVLPEFFMARPGDSLERQAVGVGEVQPRIAACARRHGCYLVVPGILREEDGPPRISNAAMLVDREGKLAGIYRKVHPVAPQGSDVLEGGTSPGRDFPVFACDFGRLGIQICFDMLYDDGWQALARQGAEIVALPSANPAAIRPALYALRHHFFIVSSSPRHRAAVINPIGAVEAEINRPGVLVHEIDLSFAILQWEAVLEEGEGLRRKFGDRVGCRYYNTEDSGIFWSNDPATTIGQMIASLGLVESDANAERIRLLQDRARGGPPVA